MTEITYTVPAMHCGHCEKAVVDEVEQVGGVLSVEVDLETKRVTVRGEGLDDTQLRAAVAEAGYEAV